MLQGIVFINSLCSFKHCDIIIFIRIIFRFFILTLGPVCQRNLSFVLFFLFLFFLVSYVCQITYNAIVFTQNVYDTNVTEKSTCDLKMTLGHIPICPKQRFLTRFSILNNFTSHHWMLTMTLWKTYIDSSYDGRQIKILMTQVNCKSETCF